MTQTQPSSSSRPGAQGAPTITSYPTLSSSSRSMTPPVMRIPATTTGGSDGKEHLTLNYILTKAATSGTAGALAMGSNVLSLMWIRTILKYQYKNGGTIAHSVQKLYADGGLPRFYRGLPFALVQAPLCRFGDTAANTGVLIALNDWPETASSHVCLKTCAATAVASAFRVLLMPVDTFMTTMQVTGRMQPVFDKVRTNGLAVLFHGSAAAASASIVGHFPWFVTFNVLEEHIADRGTTAGQLGRRAWIGFLSSIVSDACSNLFWVVKVYKQSSKEVLSYPEVARRVISETGLSSLFFRGLETRIVGNGLQGIMFSVTWKYFEGALSRSS